MHLAPPQKRDFCGLLPNRRGRWSPDCHNRKQWGAKDKIYIYIVNMNVLKIITIKSIFD
jgi:hypothetical protein